MYHQFSVIVAEELGVESAIILSNLQYWIKKNQVNGKNFHEGRYWTYNSVDAWSKLFPYMKRNALKKALLDLVSKNILLKGNFNENPYDRTNWYAFVDEEGWIGPIKNPIENGKMPWRKTTNPLDENDQSTLDENDQCITNIKHKEKTKVGSREISSKLPDTIPHPLPLRPNIIFNDMDKLLDVIHDLYNQYKNYDKHSIRATVEECMLWLLANKVKRRKDELVFLQMWVAKAIQDEEIKPTRNRLERDTEEFSITDEFAEKLTTIYNNRPQNDN